MLTAGISTSVVFSSVFQYFQGYGGGGGGGWGGGGVMWESKNKTAHIWPVGAQSHDSRFLFFFPLHLWIKISWDPDA